MDVTTVKGGEIHCLRGFGSNRPPLHSVDGFPVQDGINFLPNTPDPTINQWSYGKLTKVEVWYDDYWQNFKNGKYRRSVTWKGQTIVVEDYDWFLADIKQSMENKWFPKNKDAALDEYFEIALYIDAHKN
jgi:hypothetical protein